MNSRLILETEFSNNMTYIKDVYFDAPYKIMSPLVNGNHIDIMQMAASAGLLSGDTFEGNFHFGSYSNVTYSSQSYEKVFRSKGQQTRKTIKILVDDHAHVIYMPYPVIPFGGSDYCCNTEIRIDSSATFAYSDIFTCGRTGMDEYYAMKAFSSKLKIYVDNSLIFADNTLIDPAHLNYECMGMWEDYTHNGMMYIHKPEQDIKELTEQIRAIITDSSVKFGVSSVISDAGVLIRILGKSGDTIYNIFKNLIKLL